MVDQRMRDKYGRVLIRFKRSGVVKSYAFGLDLKDTKLLIKLMMTADINNPRYDEAEFVYSGKTYRWVGK
jgi:outer membrane receptor for monomeric catechols